MLKKKTLTKQEEIYFRQLIRGEVISIDGIDALLKANDEGRININLSDPEIKLWSDRVNLRVSCMIISNLLNKRDRKENLTNEDIKIIKDYEENRTLPDVS